MGGESAYQNRRLRWCVGCHMKKIEFHLKENDKGFSLVELSVLLGAMAILAAMAIPMLSSSMRSMQLASDARSVASTMTYAKLSAASLTTRCRLTFDIDNSQWKLERRNPATGNYELQDAINQLSRGIAHSGIIFKSNSSSAPPGFPNNSSTVITFSSRGTLIEPTEGIGIVYLSDDANDYAITSSTSGKVQIWRYRDSQWVAQ
jgi:Tfp pilus assembly protein FimT